MENLSTEATYALAVSIATLITSFAGWIKVASNSKARESTAKNQAEMVKIEFQRQILSNNRHFQQEIDDLRAEGERREKSHLADKAQWEASNKKLSDELKEQARDRAEMRAEIANYQGIVISQGKKLEAQDNDIKELQTQVVGFKALADELKQDRNRIAAELEQTKQERDAALKASLEKDATIAALHAEKDALVQKFDERIKALEKALIEKDAQIQRLTERVEELTLQNQLEDVPTEPKPAGLADKVIELTVNGESNAGFKVTETPAPPNDAA